MRQGQGADATQDEPAIEGRRDGAGSALDGSDFFEKRALFFRDDGTAGDVAMAANVFRGGMNDEIGAEIEGALDDGRPGVVAKAKGTGFMSEIGHLAEVGDFKLRI